MREPPVVSRLRPYTETVFAEMTALAVRTGSVNLGQGFPDTDGPPGMLRVATESLNGGINQYPPGPGRPELRAAVAEHRARYGLAYDPDNEVLVTVGATEAITAALLGLTETGDEVIVLEPYYDSYGAAVAMSGASRRAVSLRRDGDRFGLDLDELRAAVRPNTRAILVNSPHNPTGTVFTEEELAGLARLCTEHDLIAITDEVYEHLVFDGNEHHSLAEYPGMRERTVAISSAGKSFNCTGWKIGWVCAPPPLLSAVRAAKQFLTFVGGAPLQPAVAHALRHEGAWVGELRESLRRKRDRLTAGLTQAGFNVYPSAGTYFVCADVRPLGFADGVQFCWSLPERVGVAAVPVAAFCDDQDPWRPLVRFAFCKRDEVLDDAVTRLRGLC